MRLFAEVSQCFPHRQPTKHNFLCACPCLRCAFHTYIYFFKYRNEQKMLRLMCLCWTRSSVALCDVHPATYLLTGRQTGPLGWPLCLRSSWPSQPCLYDPSWGSWCRSSRTLLEVSGCWPLQEKNNAPNQQNILFSNLLLGVFRTSSVHPGRSVFKNLYQFVSLQMGIIGVLWGESCVAGSDDGSWMLRWRQRNQNLITFPN